MLNSIGVPPAARTPSLIVLGEAAQVEVAGHRLDPGVGDADRRPAERLVVEADPLHVGAGVGALGPVEDAGRARPRQTVCAEAAPSLIFSSLLCDSPPPALPGPQPAQVAPHLAGIDVAARQVHVGVGDQPALVAAQRHPLRQHVVGVGQPRPGRRIAASRGSRRSTRSAAHRCARRRRRSSGADRAGSRTPRRRPSTRMKPSSEYISKASSPTTERSSAARLDLGAALTARVVCGRPGPRALRAASGGGEASGAGRGRRRTRPGRQGRARALRRRITASAADGGINCGGFAA